MFKRLLAIVLLSSMAWAAPHSVALSWTASTDAATNPTLTYNVYRATASSCTVTPLTWTKINTSAVTTLTYSDSNVQIASYCYTVTAVLNGAESPQSNLAPAVIPLAAPTGLVASPD
jgi:hypothetical protein